MASYTQSIREILQANKTPQQDLTNVNDVYNIATACLFDKMPQNVIDNNYKQQFITGFALHFFNEEIGYETLPLWKIALNEKIYNSGSYINKIFANLDKEIFADYKVKQVASESEHEITKTGTGTLANERVDNTVTTSEDSATKSEIVANTLTGTVESDGTITHAKTGTDTVAKTGTDEKAKTGYDTDTHTGTDTSAHTGTQGTESSSTQETTNTGTTGNDHNLIQVQSDTPMGSLSNLRTPGGDARGSGVTYANGQTYNYMSGAQEVDESNVQTDNTEQDVTGSESSETTFNDTTTETKNLTDRAEYHSTDTETLNLQDLTTYNSTDTETRDTIDTTSKTDNTQTTGTDEKTGTVTVAGDVTDTQTRNITDTDAGTNSETTNGTDYTLNWEMLYRSMPLLNKVWEQFDDLFMIIF